METEESEHSCGVLGGATPVVPKMKGPLGAMRKHAVRVSPGVVRRTAGPYDRARPRTPKFKPEPLASARGAAAAHPGGERGAAGLYDRAPPLAPKKPEAAASARGAAAAHPGGEWRTAGHLDRARPHAPETKSEAAASAPGGTAAPGPFASRVAFDTHAAARRVPGAPQRSVPDGAPCTSGTMSLRYSSGEFDWTYQWIQCGW